MKPLLILLFAHLLWINGLLAQCAPSDTLVHWVAHELPPAPGFSIYSMDVVDERTIWGTGAYWDNILPPFGFVWIKSNDGGCTWSTGKIPVPYNNNPSVIKSIVAKNRNTAFVTFEYPGSNTTPTGGIVTATGLLRTTDGGISWSNPLPVDAFSATGSFVNFVHFFNANDGVICGDMSDGYPEIYTSNDGGENWARIPASNVPLLAIQAPPVVNKEVFGKAFSTRGDTIWVATSHGRVYRSIDKGVHWAATTVENRTFGTKLQLSMSFKDALHGIVAFDANKSWRTTDGGTTWSIAPKLPGSNKLSVIPGTNTHIIKNIPLLLSVDNGDSWTPLAPFEEGVADCKFLDAKTGWGYAGNIMFEWRASKVIGTQPLPLMAITSPRQAVPIQQEITYFGLGNPGTDVTTDLMVQHNGLPLASLDDSETGVLPQNGVTKTIVELLPSKVGNYEIITKGVSKFDNAVVYEQKVSMLVSDTLVAKGMAEPGKFVHHGMSSGSSYSDGTQLDIISKDTLTGLSVFYKKNQLSASNFCKVTFLVHGFSPGSAIPDKVLYKSPARQITEADIESWIYQKLAEPLVLEPGKYVLQLNVQGAGSNVYYFGRSIQHRDTAAWTRNIANWYKESKPYCLVFRAHFNPRGNTVATTVPEAQPIAIKCSPNPTPGLFSLSTHLEIPAELRVEIYDAAGRRAVAQQFNASSGDWAEIFDLSAFPNGVFFIRVAHGGKVWMGKVIKS